VNQLILETLTPTGVPVAYMTYTGNNPEYIVFNCWGSPLTHADNRERRENVTVQIDIFSKGDFTNLVQDVKQRMIDADFMKVQEGSGNYIEDTDIFRKTLRFSYTR